MGSIQYISLKGKTVMFRLTDYECFFLGNKVCSIEVQNINIKNLKDRVGGIRSNIAYCQGLRDSILERGLFNPIRITEHKLCGHYTFSDGQHRACIAGKLDICVPVVISVHEGDCYCCYWKRHNIRYLMKSWVYERYWTSRRYRWLLKSLLKKPASYLVKL